MDAHVHSRNTIHQGRVFDITIENVTFPNGFTADMEIIRHPGASAIVPLVADDKVLLIKQYRHAVGGYIWEIPAGTLDVQEKPIVCARRELTEETGYAADTWEPLGAITPVPGYSDEKIHIFLARDLKPAHQHLDADEILEVHTLPLAQVTSMMANGQIQDAKTMVGLFLTLQHLYAKH